nr:hypothetical protein [Mycoplasmopsis bovis]
MKKGWNWTYCKTWRQDTWIGNANAETIAKLKKEIDLFLRFLKSVIELKGDKEFFKFHANLSV